MTQRLKRLHRLLKIENLHGLLVVKKENISYVSGFRGDESMLLVAPQETFLITNFKYREEAMQERHDVTLRIAEESPYKVVGEIARKLKIKKLGFETNSLLYHHYKKLNAYLGDLEMTPTDNLVESLRAIKSEQEIKRLRKAAAITGEALEFLCGWLEEGMRESDIAARLEYFMRSHGALGSSFETIVASGKRTSMPHAIPSKKAITSGEPVLIDMGANFGGYQSDLTRVVFLDKITRKLKRIYTIILQAQKEAIKSIRPGIKIAYIDRIARRRIEREGLGKFFGHALGHGVGLEVHEEPFISQKNSSVLMPGMVFTIEPAVYIPRYGGIRIEDMVLVTKNGCEILTASVPKDMKIV